MARAPSTDEPPFRSRRNLERLRRFETTHSGYHLPVTDDDALPQELGALPTLAGSVERERAREATRERLFGAGAALTIGRFTVVERVGQGGMGVVYAAYDPELDRKVALKLLPWQDGSPATREATARLLREAKAMARVSHPNVVTVYEVGKQDQRVFVAMEFVPGTTLDQWQREQPRTWKEIVAVYLQAGHGLVAVHGEGLVHRDFKPTNVIIDRRGHARVLDFGIARPVGDPSAQLDSETLADETDDAWAATPTGGAVGTPGYMAPEQYRGEAADARSDQFGFCAALWEALYENRPFKGNTVPELVHNVLEAKLDEPANRRGPAALLELLRRGLAHEPDDRFDDMSTLVGALERIARPMPQRAWPIVVTLGLGVGVLVVATDSETPPSPCEGAADAIAAVWNDTRRSDVRAAFEGTSRAYAAASFERVSASLDQYAADWTSAREEACRATLERGERSAELLDRSTICLDQRRQDLEAAVAVLSTADRTVLDRAPRVLSGLRSIANCTDAALLLQDVDPPPTPELREQVDALRAVIAQSGSERDAGRYESAHALALEAARRATELDYPPVAAEARLAEGKARSSLGDYEGAKQTLEEAYWTAIGAEHRRTAFEAARTIAQIGAHDERPDAALGWARQAETLVRLAGYGAQEHAVVATARGVVLSAAGRYDEAVAELRRAVEHVPGPSLHHTTILLSLGTSLMRAGDYPGAREVQERALAGLREAYGPMHPEVAAAIHNLGTTDYQQGETESALASFREAAAIYEQAVGPEHPNVGLIWDGVGMALSELGRHEEAIAAYEHALEILRKALGERNATVAGRLDNMADSLADLGRFDEAERTKLEALEVLREALGPEHPEVARSLHSLGTLYGQRDDYDRALERQRESLTIWEAALGPEHPDIAYALAGICNALVHSGRAEQAIDECERALRLRQQGGVAPVLVAESQRLLGQALWSDPEQRSRARALLLEAREGYASTAAGARQVAGTDEILRDLGIEIPEPEAKDGSP